MAKTNWQPASAVAGSLARATTLANVGPELKPGSPTNGSRESNGSRDGLGQIPVSDADVQALSAFGKLA